MGDLTTAGQKWLIKAGMSGNAFRLPDKIEPGKFEQVISMWYTCFCGNMKTEQVKTMRNFKFLWRRDDDRISSRPVRGIAMDFADMKFLMSSGRIDPSDFPSISIEKWAEVEGFTGKLVFEEVKQVKVDGRVTVPAQSKTSEDILSTLDAIVSGITNRYYDTAGANVGGITKAYFEGAKDAAAAMEVVCSNMSMYLPLAVAPTFALGAYDSYDSLMAALRRFYGEDECQETMIDVVRKIQKIVKKDLRMEQKISEFRELAHRLMIVEKKDWIKPRDFTDDRTAFMEAAENYGPFTSTMFIALELILNHQQSRWPSIQALLNARVVNTSYKGWHENRPELYKILDAEKKLATSNRANAVESEVVGYAGAVNRSRNSKKTQSKTKQSTKKTKTSKKKSSSSKTDIDKMCRFCTQCANKPVYHDGPYGGGKNCRYGKNGKLKKSARRLNSVQQNDQKDDGESASQNNNDDGDDEDDAYSGSGDSESDVGALYEDDYLPRFGGGFGEDI